MHVQSKSIGASINGIYPLNDTGAVDISAAATHMRRQAELSFEVFPAKTASGHENLLSALQSLSAYNLEFISVTYGAGGASRQGTAETAKAIYNRLSVPVMAHITFAGQEREDVIETLEKFKDIGIRQILALRGDIPAGGAVSPRHPFTDTIEFISHVKDMGFEAIRTTAYPDIHLDAKDGDADFDWLLAKFDAGASEAITQFFFDAERFLRLRDRLDKFGFAERLIPGILAFSDSLKMRDFAGRCGVYIPPALEKELDKTADTDLSEAHALSVLLDLWLRLSAEGLTRYHIYTLNKAQPTQALLELLGISAQQQHQAASPQAGQAGPIPQTTEPQQISKG